MFGSLAEAVEELGVPVDPEALVEVLWLSDRLAAKVSQAVGAVDAAKLWDLSGATSMRAFLKDKAGCTGAAAQRMTVTAKKLTKLPVTAGAWRTGVLSGGQVEAITAVIPEHHLDAFAKAETELVPALAACSVGDTSIAMRQWRSRIDALDDQPQPVGPTRELHLSPLLDGRGALNANLDPDLHELVRTALSAAERPDTETEKANGLERTPAQRRADALGDICHHFLNTQTGAGGATASRHRPHVNVIVDLHDLAEGEPGARYANGGPVATDWLAATLCDSWVRSVFMAGRTRIIDYGTETRTAPSDLWHAIVTRDEHCRFPGCDRPAAWCDAHHVIHWEHGGLTRADNLVLHCCRHHHLIHRPEWHEKLEPDGTLWVTDPQGNTHTTSPPRTTRPPPRAGPSPSFG